MIKCVLSDFSQVILFPKDVNYGGSLNELYSQSVNTPGFSFFDTYRLNQEVLDFYLKVKPDFQLEVSMFTSGSVQNDPALVPYLVPVFTHIISAKEIGIEKHQPLAYQQVAQKIGYQPQEIIFIDDQAINITAAKAAGMQTIQYTSNDQLLTQFGTVLPGFKETSGVN